MTRDPGAKVRIALVGCGRIGVRHAKILADLPDVEVVGMVDVDAERAGRFAAAHGGRPYSDLATMLAAEHPELVDICTP